MVIRRLTCMFLLLASACATPAVEGGSRVAAAPSRVARLVEAGDPALLVFATVWCEACKREVPEVRAWLDAAPGRRVIYVVSGSPADRVDAYASGLGLSHPRLEVVVDTAGAVARAYAVTATPTLVLQPRGGAASAPVHAVSDLPKAERPG